MKTIPIISASLCFWAALSGCSKQESAELPVPDAPAAIEVRGGVEAVAQTRADLSGVVSGTSFPANTTKVFSVVGYSGSTSPTNWSSPYIPNIPVNSGEGGALSFATPQYYPANGDKVYFYAYSPVNGTYTASSGTTSPTVAWTITGQQDIMAAQVTSGIAKTGTTPSQPTFIFTHKLKQVKFKVVTDAGLENRIKLTSLQIIGVNTKATMWLDNGSLRWASMGNLNVYNNSKGLVVPVNDAIEVGTVMFEPGPIFKVRVTTTDITYADVTVNLYGDNSGEAGVSQEVTLTIKQGQISVGAKVASWTSSDSDVTFGTKYPYVLNGNTIVTYDRFGFAGGYDFHGPWTRTPVGPETAWDANESGLNTVAARFEVAKSDIENTSVNGVAWDNIVSACAQYSQYSGDLRSWRVPTIRELKLVYDLRNELTAINKDNWIYGGVRYWSATMYGEENVWNMCFFSENELPDNTVKIYDKYLRCVRDLE